MSADYQPNRAKVRRWVAAFEKCAPLYCGNLECDRKSKFGSSRGSSSFFPPGSNPASSHQHSSSQNQPPSITEALSHRYAVALYSTLSEMREECNNSPDRKRFCGALWENSQLFPALITVFSGLMRTLTSLIREADKCCEEATLFVRSRKEVDIVISDVYEQLPKSVMESRPRTGKPELEEADSSGFIWFQKNVLYVRDPAATRDYICLLVRKDVGSQIYIPAGDAFAEGCGQRSSRELLWHSCDFFFFLVETGWPVFLQERTGEQMEPGGLNGPFHVVVNPADFEDKDKQKVLERTLMLFSSIIMNDLFGAWRGLLEALDTAFRNKRLFFHRRPPKSYVFPTYCASPEGGDVDAGDGNNREEDHRAADGGGEEGAEGVEDRGASSRQGEGSAASAAARSTKNSKQQQETCNSCPADEERVKGQSLPRQAPDVVPPVIERIKLVQKEEHEYQQFDSLCVTVMRTISLSMHLTLNNLRLLETLDCVKEDTLYAIEESGILEAYAAVCESMPISLDLKLQRYFPDRNLFLLSLLDTTSELLAATDSCRSMSRIVGKNCMLFTAKQLVELAPQVGEGVGDGDGWHWRIFDGDQRTEDERLGKTQPLWGTPAAPPLEAKLRNRMVAGSFGLPYSIFRRWGEGETWCTEISSAMSILAAGSIARLRVALQKASLFEEDGEEGDEASLPSSVKKKGEKAAAGQGLLPSRGTSGAGALNDSNATVITTDLIAHPITTHFSSFSSSSSLNSNDGDQDATAAAAAAAASEKETAVVKSSYGEFNAIQVFRLLLRGMQAMVAKLNRIRGRCNTNLGLWAGTPYCKSLPIPDIKEFVSEVWDMLRSLNLSVTACHMLLVEGGGQPPGGGGLLSSPAGPGLLTSLIGLTSTAADHSLLILGRFEEAVISELGNDIGAGWPRDGEVKASPATAEELLEFESSKVARLRKVVKKVLKVSGPQRENQFLTLSGMMVEGRQEMMGEVPIPIALCTIGGQLGAAVALSAGRLKHLYTQQLHQLQLQSSKVLSFRGGSVPMTDAKEFFLNCRYFAEIAGKPLESKAGGPGGKSTTGGGGGAAGSNNKKKKRQDKRAQNGGGDVGGGGGGSDGEDLEDWSGRGLDGQGRGAAQSNLGVEIVVGRDTIVNKQLYGMRMRLAINCLDGLLGLLGELVSLMISPNLQLFKDLEPEGVAVDSGSSAIGISHCNGNGDTKKESPSPGSVIPFIAGPEGLPRDEGSANSEGGGGPATGTRAASAVTQTTRVFHQGLPPLADGRLNAMKILGTMVYLAEEGGGGGGCDCRKCRDDGLPEYNFSMFAPHLSRCMLCMAHAFVSLDLRPSPPPPVLQDLDSAARDVATVYRDALRKYLVASFSSSSADGASNKKEKKLPHVQAHTIGGGACNVNGMDAGSSSSSKKSFFCEQLVSRIDELVRRCMPPSPRSVSLPYMLPLLNVVAEHATRKFIIQLGTASHLASNALFMGHLRILEEAFLTRREAWRVCHAISAALRIEEEEKIQNLSEASTTTAHESKLKSSTRSGPSTSSTSLPREGKVASVALFPALPPPLAAVPVRPLMSVRSTVTLTRSLTKRLAFSWRRLTRHEWDYFFRLLSRDVNQHAIQLEQQRLKDLPARQQKLKQQLQDELRAFLGFAGTDAAASASSPAPSGPSSVAAGEAKEGTKVACGEQPPSASASGSGSGSVPPPAAPAQVPYLLSGRTYCTREEAFALHKSMIRGFLRGGEAWDRPSFFAGPLAADGLSCPLFSEDLTPSALLYSAVNYGSAAISGLSQTAYQECILQFRDLWPAPRLSGVCAGTPGASASAIATATTIADGDGDGDEHDRDGDRSQSHGPGAPSSPLPSAADLFELYSRNASSSFSQMQTAHVHALVEGYASLPVLIWGTFFRFRLKEINPSKADMLQKLTLGTADQYLLRIEELESWRPAKPDGSRWARHLHGIARIEDSLIIMAVQLLTTILEFVKAQDLALLPDGESGDDKPTRDAGGRGTRGESGSRHAASMRYSQVSGSGLDLGPGSGSSAGCAVGDTGDGADEVGCYRDSDDIEDSDLDSVGDDEDPFYVMSDDAVRWEMIYDRCRDDDEDDGSLTVNLGSNSGSDEEYVSAAGTATARRGRLSSFAARGKETRRRKEKKKKLPASASEIHASTLRRLRRVVTSRPPEEGCRSGRFTWFLHLNPMINGRLDPLWPCLGAWSFWTLQKLQDAAAWSAAQKTVKGGGAVARKSGAAQAKAAAGGPGKGGAGGPNSGQDPATLSRLKLHEQKRRSIVDNAASVIRLISELASYPGHVGTWVCDELLARQYSAERGCNLVQGVDAFASFVGQENSKELVRQAAENESKRLEVEKRLAESRLHEHDSVIVRCSSSSSSLNSEGVASSARVVESLPLPSVDVEYEERLAAERATRIDDLNMIFLAAAIHPCTAHFEDDVFARAQKLLQASAGQALTLDVLRQIVTCLQSAEQAGSDASAIGGPAVAAASGVDTTVYNNTGSGVSPNTIDDSTSASSPLNAAEGLLKTASTNNLSSAAAIAATSLSRLEALVQEYGEARLKTLKKGRVGYSFRLPAATGAGAGAGAPLRSLGVEAETSTTPTGGEAGAPSGPLSEEKMTSAGSPSIQSISVPPPEPLVFTWPADSPRLLRRSCANPFCVNLGLRVETETSGSLEGLCFSCTRSLWHGSTFRANRSWNVAVGARAVEYRKPIIL